MALKTPSAAHLRARYVTDSHQAELKASAYEDSGLVFATGKGTPLNTQNIIDLHFKPHFESASLPSIRLDDLQHTCFTILLARGTHLKYVQDLAGHASIHVPLIATRTGCPTWEGMLPRAWTRSWDRVYCCQAPSGVSRAIYLCTIFAGKIESRRADANR